MTPVNPRAQHVVGGAATSQASGGRRPVVAGLDLVFLAVFAFAAPFGSLADDRIRELLYAGPTVLDVVKFVGVLVVCWLLALMVLGIRAERNQARGD